MSVTSQLLAVRQTLPAHVRLVAVSKYQPEEKLEEAYRAGQRLFGENRVQELCRKQQALPADIEWHFIGHLQRNKVKYIAPFVAMIQSVDTPELFEEIERQGARCGRVLPCLAEIHVAAEESKSGFSEEEFFAWLASGALSRLPHVRLCGLMGMATNTGDASVVKADFQRLKSCFDRAGMQCFPADPAFSTLSMGMSGDYLLAISCGATMVRLGTTIFGSRG